MSDVNYRKPNRRVVLTELEGEQLTDYFPGCGVKTTGGQHGYVLDVDDDHIYVLWMKTDDIHQHLRALPTLRPAETPKWAGLGY